MCLFVCIIVAGMLLAVLQEVISLYGCEMIIILYPVYWLILYFLIDLYCVSFHLNYCSPYLCGCFTRNDFFVCFWTVHFYIFSSLIDSLLGYICISFLFIWIILARMIAGMLLAIWQEVISLRIAKWILIHPVHWLIFELLWSVCCFFSFEIL